VPIKQCLSKDYNVQNEDSESEEEIENKSVKFCPNWEQSVMLFNR